MKYLRKDHELPLAIENWGWKYHHIGIPTQQKRSDEKYLPALKFYVSGFSESPFGIEWMRFDDNCPIHPLVQSVPHIAFEVDNLDLEMNKHNFKVIVPPNSPGSGIRVAMIEHNNAPVELIEFEKKLLNMNKFLDEQE